MAKLSGAKASGSKPLPEDQPLWLETEGLSEQKDTVNALYAGESGTGKTTALAHMANLGPILYVNAEAGLKRQPLQKLGVNTDNIRVLPRQGQPLTFELLEDTYWKVKSDIEKDPDKWAGVAWDSCTEIHIKLLENASLRGREKAEAAGKERDPFLTTLDDWGVMSTQFRTLLRRFRDLPVHFGATSLLRRDKDDDGKVIYRPAVSPAISNDLQGYMDVVGITEVAEVGGDDEYRALLRPSGKFRGKDRFGVLPRRLVDPSFDRLVWYVEGKLELDSDPVMAEAKQRRIDAGLLEETIEAEQDDAEAEAEAE